MWALIKSTTAPGLIPLSDIQTEFVIVETKSIDFIQSATKSNFFKRDPATTPPSLPQIYNGTLSGKCNL
jgi:hypothetical protein